MPAQPAPAARVWEEDLEVLDPHYRVDDVPPPVETVLYAWQHTLVDVSPYVLPLVVARAVGYDDQRSAYMISACLVMMGIFTFINATFGHRLPSVMGPSATDTGAMASVGAIFGAPAMWMGAFLGGIFEAVVGASGVLGRLRRFLPPHVCGIVVTTIGLTLARVAGGWVFADTRPAMLGLVVATGVSVILLAVVGYRFGLGLLARGSIFFSLILFGVVAAGLAGLADFGAVREAAWLGLPRLFEMGGPGIGGPGLGWTFVFGAVFGIVVGYIGSIAESIGDYAGTCAVSKITYNVRHIRRGITVEGIASAVAPLFGALPLTTYSQNTGVIATTRVASRRVIQVAAGILLLYGLSPKVGALLIVIPRPIVGVVFLVVCGMITVAGIRLLGSGEKDEAYLLTTAVSLVAALTLPLAAGRNPEWLGSLAPITRLLLTNAVVIATVLGISLNAALRAALHGRG